MNKLNETNFVWALTNWYNIHKRKLPWRETKNPYAIWVSEIMLQQTRVDTVINYYKKFMTELPNVASLANVDEQKLLSLWQGLGYYNRVRNMQVAARQIEQNFGGVFPTTKKQIESLKGIGDYTSSAIASIAFEERTPVVDGNVLRVVARLIKYNQNVLSLKAKQFIYNFLLPFMPEGNSGNFNQALMELGATVCVPNGKPNCHVCPLKLVCAAHESHDELEYPVLEKKLKKTVEKRTVLILTLNGRYLLKKRSENLLKNMYEFLNFEGDLSETQIEMLLNNLKIKCKNIHFKENAKHIFTHKTWEMKVLEGEIVGCEQDILKLGYVLEGKEEYPVPTAFKKLLK